MLHEASRECSVNVVLEEPSICKVVHDCFFKVLRYMCSFIRLSNSDFLFQRVYVQFDLRQFQCSAIVNQGDYGYGSALF